MKKSLFAGVGVILGIIAFCLVFIRLEPATTTNIRTYQHEENEKADSLIGTTEVGADGEVSSAEFVTHLPLFILDVDGQEFPNIYKSTEDESKQYRDENITDPYISATITLIDNDNSQNHITDEAEFVNHGKIKIRGNSSRNFPKKQYGFKLLDENGEELEKSLLGMEADEDWVLCDSIVDLTLMRNYLVYCVGGQIFPYTPEAKFCEVVMKEGDSYNYLGVYLLTETVKKAEGRVDIGTFKENDRALSYLICRDRYNYTVPMLSTWASDSQICYGYFSVKYPKETELTEEIKGRIEEELSTVEQVLYSDDMSVFRTYSQYLDVDSFVDYFVINEYFENYDAGLHSTYYYKDSARKLTIGPLWDYDNCLDNYREGLAHSEYTSFVGQPWFEKLLQDPVFVDKVCRRYEELRKTILSDAYIETFIDETADYLGNAAYRDRSRWYEAYQAGYSLKEFADVYGLTVNRTRDSYEEELLRFKDTVQMHANWMDDNLYPTLSAFVREDVSDNGVAFRSTLAIVLMIIFLVSIVLVNRVRSGR